VNQTDKE